MSGKVHNKEELESKYLEIKPRYKRLGENLQEALKSFLNDENIDYLGVTHRIKKFDSFWDKIERKDYENPLNEIEDICGLRIICYYTSDLEKISEIIEEEFKVIESLDKTKLLNSDEFGYRSLHFIIQIKPDWLNAPNIEI